VKQGGVNVEYAFLCITLMGVCHMSWQKKLPSLQRMNKLKQRSSEEIIPVVVAMPKSIESSDRYFVIVEFKTDILVELFKTEKEAQHFATAIFDTLQIL
jgi:hypothetical protein